MELVNSRIKFHNINAHITRIHEHLGVDSLNIGLLVIYLSYSAVFLSFSFALRADITVIFC